MKLAVLLISLLLSTFSFSQKLSTQQLMRLWSASDTSQTTKAELSYADLKQHKDLEAFNKRLYELYTFLRHHHNQRLLIRTWIYEVLGKGEFKIAYSPTDKLHLQKGLKMAGLMEDNQLLSELFSLYPRMSSEHDNSYYTLRALEMQERIGIQHFPLFYLRLINFSISMYRVAEYKAAINYGKKAVNLLTDQTSEDAIERLILQLDFLGASYKQLNMPDSVGYYYRKIRYYAGKLKAGGSMQQIWTGIAQGGIGYQLLMIKEYDSASPLLTQNLTTSVHFHQWQDAAIAKDALAQIDYAKKNYFAALKGWRIAYKWFGTDDFGKMQVSKRLSQVFHQLNQFDSAVYYYQRYSNLSITLHQQYNTDKSDALQSRIEFDNMDTALQVAKKDILEEKNIRISILIGLVLLAIIALLIYNRSRIKHKLALEQINAKQKLARLEIQRAQEQIKTFTEKIRQSESLIKELKSVSPVEKNTSTGIEAKLLAFTLVTNEGWDNFRIEFIKAYPGFYPLLQSLMGVLTPAEERLAALIHLQLNNAQIASSLGIAKESVARSKRRLKARLNLSDDQSLELILSQSGEANLL